MGYLVGEGIDMNGKTGREVLAGFGGGGVRLPRVSEALRPLVARTGAPAAEHGRGPAQAALAALEGLVRDGEASDAVRARAAQSVLTFARARGVLDADLGTEDELRTRIARMLSERTDEEAGIPADVL